MAHPTRIRPFVPPLAAALLQAAGPAAAQGAAAPASQLAPVSVSGRTTRPLAIGGWGDVPLERAPLQAAVINLEQISDRGAQRLADLIAFDPAISDAYNSEGYIDFLTVRGFVIDNRFNYRRDGLPINAETAIPLGNKARIEVLKGTSGMQAGTSAPGGLVNYGVKRPLDAALRSATLEWREVGSVSGALDLSERFGPERAFGVRVNAAAAHLAPQLRADKGQRSLFALALDWRFGPGTLLEAEFETSHQSQPSQPGFSMLGDAVPAAGDPRINLNNQPWSLPVVFDADTASLRWQQRLTDDWRLVAHAGTQRLRTDDRVAFPFGLDCNPTSSFTGTFFCDRYGSDGRFDVYDFRSENERRRIDAWTVGVHGQLRIGGLEHTLSAGLSGNRVTNRFQQAANNFVGQGHVSGTVVLPADPSPTTPNTNRDEHTDEIDLRDSIAFGERTTAWLGLRHTRLTRSSVGTDGSEPAAYSRSLTAPFLAISHAFAPDQMIYASWGRGNESDIAPNRPRFTNAGQALPPARSRQVEIGLKGMSERFEWNVAAFDIVRPFYADLGTCDADARCTRQLDGTQHHRGLDATAVWRAADWTLRAGTQWLNARRDGSAVTGNNGLEPVNVPARTLRVQAERAIAALPGLSLGGSLQTESRRQVLPDNSAQIGGWSRIDVLARWTQPQGQSTLTWRAGVDNLLDRRAWRESPYQFSHAYLFPLAPRTLRLSVQATL